MASGKDKAPESDNELAQCEGYSRSPLRTALFVVMSFASCGALPLVCWWFPCVLVWLTCRRAPVGSARWLLARATPGQRLPDVVRVRQLSDFPGAERLAVYRCLRYVLGHGKDQYERVQYDLGDVAGIRERSRGCEETEDGRARSFALYGENSVDVPCKGPLELAFGEVLHPFFVFQICSVILWCCENYFYFACFIAVTSVVGAVANVVALRRNEAALRKMAQCVCTVRRLRRSGSVQEPEVLAVDSKDLLPGDIVELHEPLHLPCDLVMLDGFAVVDEGALTGESAPVLKSPVSIEDDGNVQYSPEKHSKSTLFSGTHLLCIKSANGCARAMVSRTGFSTTKGALVRSILYPPPTKFTFHRDAFKFIGVLLILAIGGAAYSFYLYASHGSEVSDIIIKGLDLITVVIPPALPLALAIGVLNAVSAMRKRKIFCTSPKRVNEAGKVGLIVFDKTGTLTEDGLKVVGMCTPLADHLPKTQPQGGRSPSPSPGPGSRGSRNDRRRPERFTEPVGSARDLPDECLRVLVCCHSLSLLGDKTIGDPLDVISFEYTGWQMEEQYEQGAMVRTMKNPLEVEDAGISIERQYEFTSVVQRQLVIARDNALGTHFAAVKGAPEVIKNLCDLSTVPVAFEETLSSYAAKGYRVIACATKELSEEDLAVSSREDVEREMKFLGLLVLSNPLKSDTTAVIKEILKADILCTMATGDNVLTAVSVAKSCGLMDSVRPYYIGERKDGALVWTPSETGLPPLSSMPMLADDRPTGFQLAVTGPAFNMLYQSGNKEALAGVMRTAKVFARMKPDDKKTLVEEYENLGFFTGMCGDGANDCGALKAARVGLSLAETEASIAAPFTSTVPSISGMLVLLKEGRCALSTSFSVFKFMALYSMIQFTSVVILYRSFCNLGDWHYFYIDLLLIIPLSYALGKGRAAKTLSKRRPVAALVSWPVISSILLLMAVQLAFQIGIYVFASRQSWFIQPNPDRGDRAWIITHPVAVLFLFTNFQYVSSMAAYSIGKPFRRSALLNVWVVGAWLGAMGLNLFLLCQRWTAFSKWMQLPYGSAAVHDGSESSATGEDDAAIPAFPMHFVGMMLVFVAANLVVNLLIEATIQNWIPNLYRSISRKQSAKGSSSESFLSELSNSVESSNKICRKL
eukprot:m51a1_g1346 putative atpase (1146) ;mRNA; r:338230-342684